MAETLIVARRRNIGAAAATMVAGLGMEIVAVTEASARRAADAYAIWGEGVHPAGLNLGDCFADEVATDRACRLLFAGNDCSRTDVAGVI